MRFLMAHPGPHFSVHDLYMGWAEGLQRQGQDVFGYNLNDRLTFYSEAHIPTMEGGFRRALTPEQAIELAVNGLYAALMQIRPHVLFVVSGFFVSPRLCEIARAAGVKVVLLCTESPYQDGQQAKLAEHADLTIVNDPTNLSMYPLSTRYFPQAYRPTIHHPGPVVPDLASDFAFVGSAYPSRVEFFEALDLNGVDVLLAGNWRITADDSPLRKHLAHDVLDCMDNEDTAAVYRSTKVGINLYRREAEDESLVDGWAMGPREVEMAACQCFFLRDPRGEGDTILHMLPTFTDAGDASEKLRWYLKRDTERHAAAALARAAVAERTYINHAALLLRLLDKGELS